MMKEWNYEQEPHNLVESVERELSGDLLQETENENVDSEPTSPRIRRATEPYLRELAQVPVLSQEARTEIWISLERARARVAQVVFSYPDLAKEVMPLHDAQAVEGLSRIMSDLVGQYSEVVSRADQVLPCSAPKERENETIYRMNTLFRELGMSDRQIDLFLQKLVSRMELAAAAVEEYEWLFSSSQIASKRVLQRFSKSSGRGRQEEDAVFSECAEWAEDSARIARAESEIRKKREELEKHIASLRKAREEATRIKADIVAANLRLVLGAARKYAPEGMEFMDLVQEGNLGLMKAVEKYDYRLGYQFSTYAIWWIRQAITRAAQEQSKTIRTPVHLVEMIRKVRLSFGELATQLGRHPSSGELGERMGISSERVERLLGMVGRRYVSLDDPIGDGESQLKEVIGDTRKPSPEEEYIQKDLVEKVMGLLDNLDPREVQILKERFGLGGKGDSTLRQLGKEFGLTRERIRQIEKNAIRKLGRSRKVQDAR